MEITPLFISDDESEEEEVQNTDVICISDTEEDDEDIQSAIQLSLHAFEQEKGDGKGKGVARPCSQISSLAFLDSKYEKGSTSSLATCRICGDVLPTLRTNVKKCRHSFCDGCISEYVGRKLKENIHQMECPVQGCKTVLGVDFISSVVLPSMVWERWIGALIEVSVMADIVCPLDGCGKRMVNDGKGFLIKACNSCRRLFCVDCRVPWHMGMTCQQHRQLLLEAAATRMLAICRREQKGRKRRSSEKDDETEDGVKLQRPRATRPARTYNKLNCLNYIILD